ncbi:MAG: hypothetical protein JKY48_16825 [Flavobacteriales bacterium]|nr:hypothetical protein [Flavobacteriales bacterium]
MNCSYAYTLAGTEAIADNNLQVDIPVILTTPTDILIPTAKDSPSIYITQIKKMIGKWFATEAPVTTQAYFLFDISVFSATGGTNIPILQLRDIEIGIDYIDLTDLKNWNT